MTASVIAGHAPTFNISYGHIGKGDQMLLQRQTGSAKVWSNVARIHPGVRTVTAPTVEQGRWVYRLIALHKRQIVARSQGTAVYAYGDVALSTLCNAAQSVYSCPKAGTIATAGHTFSYVGEENGFASSRPPYWSHILNFGPTSCRTIQIQFAATTQLADSSDTLSIRVIQGSSDPQYGTTTLGSIGTFTATLGIGIRGRCQCNEGRPDLCQRDCFVLVVVRELSNAWKLTLVGRLRAGQPTNVFGLSYLRTPMQLFTKLIALPILVTTLAPSSGLSAPAAPLTHTRGPGMQALGRAHHVPGLARGWHGILPGQSLQAVAIKLGGSYLINADRCPPAAMIYSQTNWPEIVASDGQTIDLVEVQDNSSTLNTDDTGNSVIQGPGSIHVGQPVRQFGTLTRSSEVVRHYRGNSQYQLDPYWVLKVRPHLYFFVRANEQTGNVESFGWTPSLPMAVEAGRTQGGCY